MDETPSSVPPPEPKAQLTPAQIAFRQYFRGSFRITQGSYRGQSFVHEWTMGSGLMPQVEIPRKIPDYLKELTPPGVHVKISGDIIQRDRDTSWADLYRISQTTENIPPSESAKSVVKEVLKKELKYQLIGRYGRNFNDDIFDSYLRRTVVLGEKTDSPILDKLCLDLKAELDRLRSTGGDQISPELLNAPWLMQLENLLRSTNPEDYDRAEEIMETMGPKKVLAYVEALYQRNHRGEKFFPTSQT
jgi:hypothetical protein